MRPGHGPGIEVYLAEAFPKLPGQEIFILVTKGGRENRPEGFHLRLWEPNTNSSQLLLQTSSAPRPAEVKVISIPPSPILAIASLTFGHPKFSVQ